MEKLIERLLKFGDVKVCKAGYVFTLLIIGEKLASSSIVTSIQTSIPSEIYGKYELIECMVNDQNFFLIVLKPRVK